MSRAPLKPLDDALTELLAHAGALPGVETVTTFDADGDPITQYQSARKRRPRAIFDNPDT